MNNTKIKTFKDLIAWQVSYDLAISVYKLTKTFPRDELFGLVSQLRRCAISISSNITEGFSRTTGKDKNQFYSIAYGSLNELYSQLIICHGIGLISKEQLQQTEEQIERTAKLLNGLKRVKYTKYEILNSKY